MGLFVFRRLSKIASIPAVQPKVQPNSD